MSQEDTPTKSNFVLKRRTTDDSANSAKKAKTTFTIDILKVNTPANGLNGWVVSCDGYPERVMCHPYFNRKEPKSKVFMENTGCMQHVFLKKDPNGDTALKNSKGYDSKCLVVLTGAKCTDEQVQEWFDNSFLPSMKQLKLMDDDNLPVLNDVIEEVNCWSKALLPAGFKWMLRDYCSNYADPKCSVAGFLKRNKNHVSAIYEKGTVTKEFAEDYQLTAQNLYKEDKNAAYNEN